MSKKKPIKKRKSFKNIGLYLLYIIVLQEVIIRILFPLPELKSFNRIDYVQLGFTEQKVKQVRNTNLIISSSPDSAESTNHLNAYGFRDRNWAIKKSDKKRIFFIGDSFVEGHLGSEDSLIIKGFENKASANNEEYDLMNLGLMATNRGEYIRLLQDVVPVFKPDYVIYILYANDFAFKTRVVPKKFKADKYDQYTPRLFALISILQDDEVLPFLWNYQSTTFFKSVPSKMNPWTQHETNLKKLVTPEIATAMKAGKFNPYVINDLVEKEKYLKLDVNVYKELSLLKIFLKKHHSELLIAYIPSRHQTTNYYQQFERAYCLHCPDSIDLTLKRYNRHAGLFLTQACKKLNIPFLDLTPLIKTEEQKNTHLYWDYDEHFRNKGYFLTGSWIYDKWKEE